MNPIPEEMIGVAYTTFPKGNALMCLCDHLGPIYTDAQFTALFPHDGEPTLSPGRLALVGVLQFAAGLVFSAGRLLEYTTKCKRIKRKMIAGHNHLQIACIRWRGEVEKAGWDYGTNQDSLKQLVAYCILFKKG